MGQGFGQPDSLFYGLHASNGATRSRAGALSCPRSRWVSLRPQSWSWIWLKLLFNVHFNFFNFLLVSSEILARVANWVVKPFRWQLRPISGQPHVPADAGAQSLSHVPLPVSFCSPTIVKKHINHYSSSIVGIFLLVIALAIRERRWSMSRCSRA